MAKGAGMLAPALATMLVVLTTDAVLTPEQADAALRHATSLTFDRTDSDGCMSTNDTVFLLASGSSDVVPDLADFTASLTEVCASLAGQLLSDAEGSKHDIAVTVTGAASETDALEVARAIARSNLFKCAIFGNDPNWGRVLASAGTTRATFRPEQVSVSFNGVEVFAHGGLGADRSLVDLSPRFVTVDVALGAGTASATIWTNDLTYDYVKENAEYSS
jgi:glutamate N-acetyltransferase/amino-acid N-acetyltransferase